MERHVVASFLYPFRRGGTIARWLVGTVLVAALPLTFVLLFGYAIGCIRSVAQDPCAPPPRWRLSGRLLGDGFLGALQAAALTAPFVAAGWLLGEALQRIWRPTGDGFMDPALGWIAAVTIAALPWGIAMLLLLPPTLARYAITGRPAELAAPRTVVAAVRDRYADWNLVLVAITTAWALAVASLALAGVGVVAGAFYAILVSAHACAALAPDRGSR